MTIDDFWKKYDHCPKCRSYVIQGNLCYGCKWRWASGQYAKKTDFDLFDPTDECIRLMNRMIQE